MLFDKESIYDIMDSYGIIGDEEYGGDGTDEEFVLVGIIYGIFISSKDSIKRLKREDIEIYRFGEYSYLVWLRENEEIDLEDPIKWEKIPSAIEGPFTDAEIVGLINGGSL